MIAFFANLFGYVLNFLYEIVGNYGVAIILFSVLAKILMLPISINQQKTMKKSQKINDEMKQIQFKYKNDPEKMNQEIMDLYKREKMSPFSGCLSAIIQIVLLFSVFFLVRSPLTYMKKVDPSTIEKLQTVVSQEGNKSNYKEIAIINYINNLEKNEEIIENNENKENNQTEESNTEETQTVEESSNEENNDEPKEDINIKDYIKDVYINMNFLGLDLSKVPTEELTNFKVLIIPILYVISSFISIRLSTNENKKQKKEQQEKLIGDGTEQEGEQKPEYDAMAEANKSMSWLMPIMSISIALIAPLGLALYWLVNNILMILERITINKFIKD